MIQVRKLTPEQVAGICDHTFLQRPEVYRGQADDPLVAYDAAWRGFIEQTLSLNPMPYAVCVRPEEVGVARGALPESINVASVVGFPLGDRVPMAMKLSEIRFAIDHGATEIDTVLRWQALREGREDDVLADLKAVAEASHQARAIVKVILEVCELSPAQIRRACELCAQAGVEFVKTSTGFGKGGATLEALTMMRESFMGGIKLSGGVKAGNLGTLLAAAIGEEVEALDPLRVRIGESSLLT